MVVRIGGKKERYDCLTRASPMTTVPSKADHVSVTCLCVKLPSPRKVIICEGRRTGKDYEKQMLWLDAKVRMHE